MIRVRVGLSGIDRCEVLAHELAHELLHQSAAARRRPLPKALEETEAEATAYVVQRALGLPSLAPKYIAWHGGSGALISASMGRIQRAVRRILLEAGLGITAI